jgi:hypothetical protein
MSLHSVLLLPRLRMRDIRSDRDSTPNPLGSQFVGCRLIAA